MLGVPPAAVGEVAAAMRPGLPADAIVTDVSSIKAQIVRDVVPHLPTPSLFVPGHPVAGTEHSGPDAAFATLFERRRCILTPIEDTDPVAVERIRAMWELAGSTVDVMTPEHHDRVLAITSHLPHLIAYTIVGTVADLEDEARTEVFKYAAGGFTDFTRIAASDPTMWRDVLLGNREAVLEMLGRFTEDMVALQRAIRWGDGKALFELFERTRAIRRGVIQAGQAYVRAAAGRRRRPEPRRMPAGPGLVLRLRLADVEPGLRPRGLRAGRARRLEPRLVRLLDPLSRHRRAGRAWCSA